MTPTHRACLHYVSQLVQPWGGWVWVHTAQARDLPPPYLRDDEEVEGQPPGAMSEFSSCPTCCTTESSTQNITGQCTPPRSVVELHAPT